MTSKVEFTISGDAAKLVAEITRAVGKFNEAERSVTDVATAMARMKREEREAEQELKRLNREASRIKEQAQTPMERYDREVRKLNEHLRAGRISQEEYGRAAARVKGELEDLSDAGGRAWGSNILGQLTAYAAGALSVSSAVGFVVEGLREIQQIGEEAGEKARASRTKAGKLKQVADDETHYRELIAKAEDLYSAGAVETMGHAYQSVFDIQSAGEMRNFELFKELGAHSLVEDVGDLMSSVKAMMKNLGEEETGSVRQLISKGLIASSYSQVAMEPLLAGIARAGGAARKLGLGDEDILAGIAETASAERSAEVGGTQMRSLLFSLAELKFRGFQAPTEGGESRQVEFDFEGKNLIQMLEEIENKGLDPAALFSALGRKEATAAFDTLLLNREQYRSTLGMIREGNTRDVVGEKMGFTSPELEATEFRARAEAGLEVSRKDEGAISDVARGLGAQRRTAREEESPWGAYWRGKWGGMRRFLLGNETIVAEGLLGGEVEDPDVRRAMLADPGVRKKLSGQIANRLRYDKRTQDLLPDANAERRNTRGFALARPLSETEIRRVVEDKYAEKLLQAAEASKEAADATKAAAKELRATTQANRKTALSNPSVDK